MHSFLEIGEINVENDLAGGLSTVEAHTAVVEPKLGGHCPDDIGVPVGAAPPEGMSWGCIVNAPTTRAIAFRKHGKKTPAWSRANGEDLGMLHEGRPVAAITGSRTGEQGATHSGEWLTR
jgi:hypothetical protein